MIPARMAIYIATGPLDLRRSLDGLAATLPAGSYATVRSLAQIRRDMHLHREAGEPVGGFLSSREGRSFGETDTPKTGRREVPIVPPLARLLAPVEAGPKDGHLALTVRGQPWGQYGLDQAFERVCKRAGLSGYTVYALRHYAITMWLRRGVPVHVVQKMAGHKNLSTT